MEDSETDSDWAADAVYEADADGTSLEDPEAWLGEDGGPTAAEPPVPTHFTPTISPNMVGLSTPEPHYMSGRDGAHTLRYQNGTPGLPHHLSSGGGITPATPINPLFLEEEAEEEQEEGQEQRHSQTVNVKPAERELLVQEQVHAAEQLLELDVQQQQQQHRHHHQQQQQDSSCEIKEEQQQQQQQQQQEPSCEIEEEQQQQQQQQQQKPSCEIEEEQQQQQQEPSCEIEEEQQQQQQQEPSCEIEEEQQQQQQQEPSCEIEEEQEQLGKDAVASSGGWGWAGVHLCSGF